MLTGTEWLTCLFLSLRGSGVDLEPPVIEMPPDDTTTITWENPVVTEGAGG